MAVQESLPHERSDCFGYGDRLLADHLYKLDLPDSKGFGKNLRQVDAINRIKGLRLNRYSRRYFQPGDKFESPCGYASARPDENPEPLLPNTRPFY